MSDKFSAIIAATLANCDAAVAADPSDAGALERRAQFRALHGDDKAQAVADCRAALELRHRKNSQTLAALTRQARGWLKKGRSSGEFRVYFYAQTIAHLDAALARTSRPAALLNERAVAWANLGERARAEADFDKLRAIRGDSARSWCAQAAAFAGARDNEAASAAYRRAIQMGAREGRWNLDVSTCLRRAQSRQISAYQQFAWLDLAIEIAPHDIAPLLARARLNRQYRVGAADADWQRALDLQPDNPAIYEARARANCSHRTIAASDEYPAIVADFAHALRLRIAANVPRGVAKNLRARAQKLKGNASDIAANTEALAIYDVAIERAPEDAMLHTARAALKRVIFDVIGRGGALIEAALQDDIRALQLNPQLKTSRTAVANYFALSLRRKTAHEQLETLIETRHTLSKDGFDATLIEQIAAQIEATLRVG